MLGLVLLSVAALSLPPPTTCYSADGTPATEGPTLYGDIDGDGSADRVSTRVEWLDAQHCRAWLVVQTDRQTLEAEIVSEAGLLAPPGLAGLVRLDRRPGLEIAVIPSTGASTTFVAVYALRSRGLVLLNGAPFGHGGSVLNRSGVDCARSLGALMVLTSASWRERAHRYRVERRFFGLRGDTFVLKFTERYRVRPNALLRFPELANELQPFPSCTVVS